MNKLKSLREQFNLTRNELCEMTNIPYRTLQDWELGNHKCPDYVVELIEYKIKNEKERS